MLCDICKKNEASVHITKIVNGEKEELNICDNCAKDVEGFDFVKDMNFISPFSFQNILSGIMNYANKTPKEFQDKNLVCKNCGMTYSEFKEKGLLGCSECYKNFSSIIMPVIQRVQGNAEHIGKIPKKAGKDIIKHRRILKLKEELQKVIVQEEYERAAEIRDEIRELQHKE